MRVGAVCSLVVLLAACGGAESRKARHLAKGQEFLAADNFEKARVEFRNALQIAPADSQARFENGVVDEKLGNPREAAQFYQGAIDVNPTGAPARAALGRLYLFSGAPQKALDAIKPALEAHPTDVESLTVRAAAKMQLKDVDGALQDALRAVQSGPDNENAVAVLAGIYQARNEASKARILLEDAVKRIPGTVDLRLALAQIYASLNLEAQVEEVLIELVRIQPLDKAHRVRLAQYYARLNHNDEAERVLRVAVAELPKERDLKLALIDFLAARRSREAAEKELLAAIAADPKDWDFRLAEGQFYEQGKDPARAETVYRLLVADADPAPDALVARNRLARLKIAAGDTPGARKLLSEVLLKSPRDNDALVLRGNLELGEKDPKSAIADFRAVLRDQPNSVGVMRSLARAHLANGEPGLAEEAMRKAVDVDPKDAASRLDLAQLLAQTNKPDQAKPVIDELIKQHPDDFPALELQTRVCAATQDFACAKAAADAMVAMQPKAAVGYFYEGSVAEFTKHPDDALRFYAKALEVQPDATEPVQASAVLLAREGRVPEALQLLDDAATRVPTLPTALNLKGELLLSAQRFNDAEAAFRGASLRDPAWWLPYRNLARAQHAGHDDAAAMATLTAAIPRVKDAEPLQLELAHDDEGLGKVDEAMQWYEATLRKNPQSEVAANNLAMLLVTHRQDKASLDRAKELSQRFSVSPNPDFLDTYGWVLYKRGESAAAVAVLQSVLVKVPEAPIALYHLGMAQASVGQDDAARSNLSQSLKSGKNFLGMDEARATLDRLAKLPPLNTPPKS